MIKALDEKIGLRKGRRGRDRQGEFVVAHREDCLNQLLGGCAQLVLDGLAAPATPSISSRKRALRVCSVSGGTRVKARLRMVAAHFILANAHSIAWLITGRPQSMGFQCSLSSGVTETARMRSWVALRTCWAATVCIVMVSTQGPFHAQACLCSRCGGRSSSGHRRGSDEGTCCTAFRLFCSSSARRNRL